MGFVTDWASGAAQRRWSELEQLLNDRPDSGALRRKLLNIGPIVDTKNEGFRVAGPLSCWTCGGIRTPLLGLAQPQKRAANLNILQP